MWLLDNLVLGIGEVDLVPEDAKAWLLGLRTLYARAGATEADTARAIWLVAQACSRSELLTREPDVRALTRTLFAETGVRGCRALVAVPVLLDLAEQGHGTLEDWVEYTLGVVGELR